MQLNLALLGQLLRNNLDYSFFISFFHLYLWLGDIMENKVIRCPNCNRVLNKDWCIHCGYMTNGEFVQQNPINSISDVEIYLGDRYEKINRNKNTFFIFILGPLYFCYSRFILCGLLFVSLEILIFYLLNILFGSIFIRPFLIFLLFALSFLLPLILFIYGYVNLRLDLWTKD